MSSKFDRLFLRLVLGIGLLTFSLAYYPAVSFAQEETGISRFVAQEQPPVFDSAEAVLKAFKEALAADDFDGVAKLLGLDAAKLKGDEGTMKNYARIRDGAAKMLILEDDGDQKIIEIGNELWPLPFPIVKNDGGKWAFDTEAGLQEIINRRVGENELQAIETAHLYVDAQSEYATEDRDGDGVLEYAQKLVSSEGKTDGLYWPTGDGNGDSPAGAFVEEAALDKAKSGEGYFGYHFRILTGQGDNIAGGSYDYVINGNMIAGFGLVAWPVKYGETGVKTFVVNQQGVVYETDLGPSTEAIVKYIDRFNPDETWNVVGD